MIKSALDNSGTLWANNAQVIVAGAASGSGTAVIDGSGSLTFAGASSQNVVFGAGAAGTLQLGDSFHFKGTIAGFATGDAIDLSDIDFTNSSFSYVENPAHTGGVLTVSDGTHSAELAIAGSYDAANFQLAEDKSHGTILAITNAQHDLLV